MPTELEELVGFLRHGNTQIRQVATENLVPYSEKDPSIFKTEQLKPIKDLKFLVRDYPPIAKHVLTMLINLSGDRDVLQVLFEDEAFLETIMIRITNAKEPNADLLAMLLANMAKDDRIARLLTLKRDTQLTLSKSPQAIDQLMDAFVRGAEGSYNAAANFDYLAYLFADLAKFPAGAAYLLSEQKYDGVHPLAKLLPFTTHSSVIRRQGASAATKNAAFARLDAHTTLLAPPLDILPFVLRPLASGADAYDDEEEDKLPDELQLLDDSCKREADDLVLRTHLDTLLVLTGTRKGRDHLRDKGVYYVVRECHMAVEDDEVREGCDRLVQVLMRDEANDEEDEVQETSIGKPKAIMAKEEEDDDDDDDDKVVEIAL